jgi:uncharacterized metal-binding protein YceD (DUF177 family)
MLPLRRVHPEEADGSSSCNKDALKILNSLIKNEDNDPRWESLKSIKIKN